MADLVDLSKKIKAFKPKLQKEVRILLKESANTIIDYAATHHRYKNQSGNLSKGGEYRLDFPSILIQWSGELSGASKYVKSVHDGHGTWKPDKFFPNAVKKTSAKIRKSIKKEITTLMDKSLSV